MSALSLPENFNAALMRARSQRGDGDLSAILARLAERQEADLRPLLAQRYQFALAESLLASGAENSPDFSRLSIALCRERNVVVLGSDVVPRVAVEDPWDADLLQWLTEQLGHMPTLVWASPARIRDWINDAVSGQSRYGSVQSANDSAAPSSQTRSISIETISDASSPVVRFVDSIILEGWKSGASDIHFETGRDHLDVRFRLDGVLVPSGRFSASERPIEEIINRIKVLAQLDVSETRVPQDGRFRARVGTRDLDFRVSIMPSIFGEDAVIRLLDKAQLRTADSRIDLDRLGFQQETLRRMRAMALLPHGMLLVTGPTGSGKTTTLYAVLSEIYSASEKLITIEDPVEYELPGVLQIPVNEKKGLTFARGLRSILRHDPDRILVGEIRDKETAEIAIQAALTGHLVFTTVHANNVFDVVGRFTHMGVDLYNFMSALNGVVAQRLLRVNCPHCAAKVNDSAQIARVAQRIAQNTPITLRQGAGCDQCRHTGYKGRMAIAEVLPVDEALREMVIQRESGLRLRQYAAAQGVVTLAQRAYELVARGTTSLEEVDRVVGASD